MSLISFSVTQGKLKILYVKNDIKNSTLSLDDAIIKKNKFICFKILYAIIETYINDYEASNN